MTAEPLGYIAPTFQGEGFNCPHSTCRAFAHQQWRSVLALGGPGLQNLSVPEAAVSLCTKCRSFALWINEELIYPTPRRGAAPNPDMPERVRKVYEEARQVAPISRKSAAALLRLALQILIDDELEPGTGTINRKIGTMVKKGLDPQVQMAMDALRIFGNESVHPGEINLDGEDAETITVLFGLLNHVVDQMITRPKAMESIWAKIPETAKEGVEKRDA